MKSRSVKPCVSNLLFQFKNPLNVTTGLSVAAGRMIQLDLLTDISGGVCHVEKERLPIR